MPIKQLTPQTLPNQQLAAYNKAGPANQSNVFSLPADTAWAVVGTLVADAVTIANVATLEAAIQALPGALAVEPLHWAQSPVEILANAETEIYETVLHVSAEVTQTIAFGGGKGQTKVDRVTPYKPPKPPLGKKFIVWGLSVPAGLDQAGIAVLEAAIAGAHAGITSAHHLLDGVIDAECVGSATIVIETHTRLDRIPTGPSA